ncbi:MAG: rhomboid family intramembrane serine protease [Bdellovibrionales bacterium]|nr:rhomboid family intramembrane serine protease [Bdellovibrionales bacterium]
MFLPIGDDNSRVRTTPVVMFAIVGINCFFWYLQLTLGETFTYGYAATPYEITSGEDLVNGSRIVENGRSIAIPHAPGPTPLLLTLLTAMFMHGSWMHIIGNMVYLVIFGDQIEDLLGHARFLLFYLACGFAATAAHIIAAPSSTIPSLGASGAIAGVLGAYLLRFSGNRVRVLVFRHITYMPAYLVLGGWFLLQLVGQVGVAAGEATGVAYMAHIGGFIAGLLLVLLFAPRRRYT